MNTSVESQPADRPYLNRHTRAFSVRVVCMLIAAIALAISTFVVDRELDYIPDRATLMNADSEQTLGSRRIVYSAAAPGVIG
jgi:hypothetical protein